MFLLQFLITVKCLRSSFKSVKVVFSYIPVGSYKILAAIVKLTLQAQLIASDFRLQVVKCVLSSHFYCKNDASNVLCCVVCLLL